MTEEQAVAPIEEATEETVDTSQEASEATENTEGQDESQPAEPEEQSDGEEVSKSKARRERRKAEMERLRKEAREATEALEKARERQARMQKAAEGNTPPQESDFQDYNEYLIALGTYQAAKAMDGRSLKELQDEEAEYQKRLEAIDAQSKQEIAQTWAMQAEDARARYADFDAVVGAPDLPISERMAGFLAQSDMGADMAYYLGTHKAEAARIAQLDPFQQAMEIGRLEARITTPRPNTQTRAPDPVQPVKPRATASKSPEKMTMAEYMAARRAGKI